MTHKLIRERYSVAKAVQSRLVSWDREARRFVAACGECGAEHGMNANPAQFLCSPGCGSWNHAPAEVRDFWPHR